MIKMGPLADLMLIREVHPVAGRGQPDRHRDGVGLSRLGNSVSPVIHDEDGLYTKENKLLGVAQTQRRRGRHGRRTMATTNAWTRRQTQMPSARGISCERRVQVFPAATEELSWAPPGPAQDLQHVRRLSGVTIASIEAEVNDLMETDPAQAERFFGNRLVTGVGAWLRKGWESAYARTG